MYAILAAGRGTYRPVSGRTSEPAHHRERIAKTLLRDRNCSCNPAREQARSTF